MADSAIARFEQMLAAGRDSALLRFGLGSELLKAGRPEHAIAHLSRAVELDPNYSAAWKLLGRALAEAGQLEQALATYRRGVEVAQERGDKQAAKEMSVYARRIEKQLLQ